MISLILDSSNVYLNVGLAINNKLVDKISYEAWQKQSEYMIPEIHNILSRNKIDPKNVNEILVTIGPGSYTGVRIALTIAKVYGYSLNIPVYTFSSLEVLEVKDKYSICLENARSKRSYIGVYFNKEVILKDQVLTNTEVLEYISKHQEYALCGDLEYLNLSSSPSDIFNTMLYLKNESKRVLDIKALKAIYLKD